MIVFSIPSRQERFRLRMGIRSQRPLLLIVKGCDPNHAWTCYVSRQLPFKASLFEGPDPGYREFSIPFPISPRQLVIQLYEKESGGHEDFRIEKLEPETLPEAQLWTLPEMHRFIDFATRFSQRAGFLNPGFYYSPGKEFLIEYLPVIRDRDGQPLVTPARINRLTGNIQVSQTQMRRYSIPIRLFILLHERCHYQIPTRSEIPADSCALRSYLTLGYPEIEGIYAATKVFSSHPETVGARHLARVEHLHEGIRRHRKAAQAKQEANQKAAAL